MKVLKILGIIVVVLVLGVILLNLSADGMFDTRFWTNDGYSEFLDGVYVGGEALEPGSYDVQVRGGLTGGSAFAIYPDYSSFKNRENERVVYLSYGDKGFNFTLGSGEVLELRLSNWHEMRIKKVV